MSTRQTEGKECWVPRIAGHREGGEERSNSQPFEEEHTCVHMEGRS